MKKEEILRLLNDFREENKINFKIQTDKTGGIKLIRMGKDTFKSPIEFLSHVADTGMAKREVFNPNTPISLLPRNGPLSYNWLARQAKQTGIELVRESYHIEDQDQLRSFQQKFVRNGKYYGIVNPDEDVTTVLRGFKNGKEIQTDRLLSELGLQIKPNMSAKELSKLPKRLKAILSERTYAVSGVHEVRVGNWDLSGISGLTQEALEKSKDGISLMRPGFGRKLVAELYTEASRMEAEVKGKSTKHAQQVQREARAMRRKAKDLSEAIKSGGLFNLRAMGLKGFEGQIKGNVMFGSEKIFSKGGKYHGYDIITDTSNITNQLSFRRGMQGCHPSQAGEGSSCLLK